MTNGTHIPLSSYLEHFSNTCAVWRNAIAAALLLFVAQSLPSVALAQCSQAVLPQSADVPLSANESSSASTVRDNPQPSALRIADPASRQNAITVPENTPLRVTSNQPISSRMTRLEVPLSFTVNEDVMVGGQLVIPCGATARGAIVNTQKAGVLTGSAQLVFELNALELGGKSYPLYTYQFKVSGASKTRPTEKKVGTGAVIGAIVLGSLSGNANGAATAGQKLIGVGTGAALGAGVGTAVSSASPAPMISIPAESEMLFTLSSPLAVVPVDVKEAMRLARGMKPGGPVLYVRDETW